MSAARDGTAVLRDVRAVLFDLDGTFADTAPDMARALNAVRHARQLPPVPLSQLRPHVSNGARGMLQAGFDLKPGDGDFPALRDAFYEEYAANLCIESRWFDGISTLIDELEKREIIWGIVTNKAARFLSPCSIHSPSRCAPPASFAATLAHVPSRTRIHCSTRLR